MKNKNLFLMYGIFQTLTLGLIVFFLLQTTTIGNDTRITLSILFPLFLLITEYIIYSK